MITVNVRFSAALAQAAGSPRLRLALADGATVGALLDELARSMPHLAARLPHLIVAVAGRHVGRDEPLVEGQEVVIVMPAAGGELHVYDACIAANSHRPFPKQIGGFAW